MRALRREAQTALFLLLSAAAPTPAPAWEPDRGDGTFRNPVLHADYSDPDVVRVGSDFYLTASDFHYVPGLPILHSKDLVHWRIVGHAAPRLGMDPKYDLVGGNRYGRGVWAPTLRHHDGRFWIFFCTPDEGLFMTTARNPAGPWSPLVHVEKVAGWEDPTPLWDDDGQAYLVHSVLGGGPLILHRMSPDGRRLLDAGKVIVEDKVALPVLEGPKLYKRGGHYYIFAPARGVKDGDQVVLRAKSIAGPYEHRVVLSGTKTIQGPHQGGYVETPSGEGWFLHFNLTGAHGRIVHLQPVRWVDGWPVMGRDGKPMETAPRPALPAHRWTEPQGPADEFSGTRLGLHWQWNHNPLDAAWSLRARPGHLSLTAVRAPSLLAARNTLTAKLVDPAAKIVAGLRPGRLREGQRAGLAMLGSKPLELAVVVEGGVPKVVLSREGEAVAAAPMPAGAPGGLVELGVEIAAERASFSFGRPGATPQRIGEPVPLQFDWKWWKAVRPALFSYTTRSAPAGRADFDYVRYTATEPPPPSR